MLAIKSYSDYESDGFEVQFVNKIMNELLDYLLYSFCMTFQSGNVHVIGLKL